MNQREESVKKEVRDRYAEVAQSSLSNDAESPFALSRRLLGIRRTNWPRCLRKPTWDFPVVIRQPWRR